MPIAVWVGSGSYEKLELKPATLQSGPNRVLQRWNSLVKMIRCKTYSNAAIRSDAPCKA